MESHLHKSSSSSSFNQNNNTSKAFVSKIIGASSDQPSSSSNASFWTGKSLKPSASFFHSDSPTAASGNDNILNKSSSNSLGYHALNNRGLRSLSSLKQQDQREECRSLNNNDNFIENGKGRGGSAKDGLASGNVFNFNINARKRSTAVSSFSTSKKKFPNLKYQNQNHQFYRRDGEHTEDVEKYEENPLEQLKVAHNDNNFGKKSLKIGGNGDDDDYHRNRFSGGIVKSSINHQPNNLVDWLETELDQRGIDSVVYGRHLWSLLQQYSNEQNNYMDAAGADLDSDTSSNSSYNLRKYTCSPSRSFGGGQNRSGYPHYQSDPNERGSKKMSPGRYCEQHQRLYRKYDAGSKENTQKPPSTTKWMHKRYLQGKIANNDYDDDDHFLSGYDHDCPDCQQRFPHDSFRDVRKLTLMNCLRSAIDKDSTSYENLEAFIEELCVKYDQQMSFGSEKKFPSEFHEFGRRPQNYPSRFFKPKVRTNYICNNSYQQQQNEDGFNNNSDVNEEKLERSENVKNQVLKYYDAFPALSGSPAGNDKKNLSAKDSASNSSSRSSMSSSGSKNSTLMKLSSFQSSMEDSVFTPETMPSTPTKTNDNKVFSGTNTNSGLQTISNQSFSNSASWNGQKIIKKILVSKDRVQSQTMVSNESHGSSLSSSSSSSKSSAVNHDNYSAKPLLKKTPIASSILGGVGSRTNRTRTGMIVAPASLVGQLIADDGLHSSSTLTTLKKLGPSVGGNGNGSVTADPNSIKNNDAKGCRKSDTPKRNNSMSSDNQSESNENSSSKLSEREMEKILNIMPSFLNPTPKSSNSDSVKSVTTVTLASSAVISKNVSSSSVELSSPMKNMLEKPEPEKSPKPISIFELKNQNLLKASAGNSGASKINTQSTVSNVGSSPMKVQSNQKELRNDDEPLGGGVMDLLPNFLKSKLSNTSVKPKDSSSDKAENQQQHICDDGQAEESFNKPIMPPEKTNKLATEQDSKFETNSKTDAEKAITKSEQAVKGEWLQISSTGDDLLTDAKPLSQSIGDRDTSLCESIEEWLNDQNSISRSNSLTGNWRPLTNSLSFLNDTDIMDHNDDLELSGNDDDCLPISRKRIEYLLNIWNQNSCLGYMEAQNRMMADNLVDFRNLESELLSIVDLHRTMQNSAKIDSHDDFIINDSPKLFSNTESLLESGEKTLTIEPSLNGISSSILSDLFKNTEADLNLKESLTEFDPLMGPNFDHAISKKSKEVQLFSEQSQPTIGSFLTSLVTDEEEHLVAQNENFGSIIPPTKVVPNESDCQPTASMPFSKRYKLKSKSTNADANSNSLQSSFNEMCQDNNQINGHIVTANHGDLLPMCQKPFQDRPGAYDENNVHWKYYQDDGGGFNYYYNDEENVNFEAYGNDLYNYDGYLLNIPSKDEEVALNDGEFLSRTSKAPAVASSSSSTNFYDALDIKFKLENRLVPEDDAKPVLKPCAFFLENSCARVDCKYSHDLSSIPCRYYNEGACFKGEFCPFLHDKHNCDQTLNSDTSSTDGGASLAVRQLDPNAKSFQFRIESDSDFPSLFDNEFQPLSELSKNSVGTDSRVNFFYKKKSETADFGNDFETMVRDKPPKRGSSGLKLHQILNNSTTGSDNSISPNYARLFNEKQHRQQYSKAKDGNGAEEEWPSLAGVPGPGADKQDFAVLQGKSQPSSSAKHAANSGRFSNFREKVAKPNQKYQRNNETKKENNNGDSNSDNSNSKLSGSGFASLKTILNPL